MKLIDTHSHPQMKQFDNDRDEVLARAREAEVGIICVGTDATTSRQAVELATQNEAIWASVGLHPNDNLNEAFDLELYAQMMGNPKVVAVGEVGLDYYRTPEADKQKFQRERFEQQIALAIRFKKPLIIHCRGSVKNPSDAHDDMTKILMSHKDELFGGVIHSFTGTFKEAQRYIELGFHIGLNGIITFARQYDDTVAGIPLERVLLETDAPYLTPDPHRGKRNEPAFLGEIARQISTVREISLSTVIEQTTLNAKKLFNLE